MKTVHLIALWRTMIQILFHRSEGFIPLRGYVPPRVRGRCRVGERRAFFRRRTVSPRENKGHIMKSLPKTQLQYI